MKSDPNHFTRNQLKARGWTDAMIRDFLGEPDSETKARFFRYWVPVWLWRVKRTVAVEQTDEWKTRLEKAKVRQAAGKKALQTRKDKLKEKVASLKIRVPHYEWDTLVEHACDHYNAYHGERSQWRHEDFESWQPATSDSDESFLHRIIVNYLRHEKTPYDSWRSWLLKQPGGEEAFVLLCQKVYTAIKESNPELAEECDRQLEEKVRSVSEQTSASVPAVRDVKSERCHPEYCKHMFCTRCGKCLLHCATTGCGAEANKQHVA